MRNRGPTLLSLTLNARAGERVGKGSEDLFLNGVISLLDFPLEAEDVLLQGLDDSLQLYLLSLHRINVGGPLLDLFLQGVELKIQKHRIEHYTLNTGLLQVGFRRKSFSPGFVLVQEFSRLTGKGVDQEPGCVG